MVLSAVQHRTVHKSEPGGHPAAGTAAQRRLSRARADEHDGRRAREAVARGDQEAHPDAAVHGPYFSFFDNSFRLLVYLYIPGITLTGTDLTRAVNVPYSLTTHAYRPL